jgi:hypothetical protein
MSRSARNANHDASLGGARAANALRIATVAAILLAIRTTRNKTIEPVARGQADIKAASDRCG